VMDDHGGIVTAEGYQTWQHLIDAHVEEIHDAVVDRFLQGRDMSAFDVESVRAAARRLAPALYARMAGYDAILAPTSAVVPPPIAEVSASLDAYRAANGAALRNTRLGNVLPCCALSLPVPDPALAVGLMVMAPAGRDAHLLRIGAAMESALGA